MTYAAIMTHVQSEPEPAPRLVCAAALARRFDARLIGVGAEMIPPLAFDNGYYSVDAEWVTAMRQSIEEQLAAAHEVFRKAVQGLSPDQASWLSGIDSPTPALACASRAADLLVVGGGPRRAASPYRDVQPAELALQAGRPVLVVPHRTSELLGRQVLLAWKDTREARRVLSDAMPFFERADGVRVVEVCERDSAEDARVRTEDVAEALRRRGVKAEAKVVSHHHHPASQVLLEEAAACGADLIALGCYGHSRLGEWVFGGVTRDLLAQDGVWLLLSH
jgi:nucleotide-binding universal stress UspA family protein